MPLGAIILARNREPTACFHRAAQFVGQRVIPAGVPVQGCEGSLPALDSQSIHNMAEYDIKLLPIPVPILLIGLLPKNEASTSRSLGRPHCFPVHRR
jgi:hypothetical protein